MSEQYDNYEAGREFLLKRHYHDCRRLEAKRRHLLDLANSRMREANTYVNHAMRIGNEQTEVTAKLFADLEKLDARYPDATKA